MPKKIKVAFLLSQFPTISETFILNQITGLLDLGQEVTIFSKFVGDQKTIHDEVKKYHLLEKTIYFGMPKNLFCRFLKGLFVFFRLLFISPRIAFKTINFIKYQEQALSLTLLFSSYALLMLKKEKSFDVIHAHFGPNGKLAIFLKDLGLIDGKVITAFHGFDISAYLKSHSRNTYDYLFKNGDLFLPISDRWRKKLLELGTPSQKIAIHRMGIDLSSFSYTVKEKREKMILLTVGRFVEKKGIKYAILAAKPLLKKYEYLEYYLVGDGPLRSEIETLIKSAGLGKRIKLFGWQKQGDVKKIMQESDILIAPSVTSENGDQEGIPVTIMEAMAVGLPVVSTKHSGIPELVKEQKSGILVAERNVQELRKAMEFLIKNPKERMEMGKMGRRIVEEEFNIKKLNKNLLKLYQNLLRF